MPEDPLYQAASWNTVGRVAAEIKPLVNQRKIDKKISHCSRSL